MTEGWGTPSWLPPGVARRAALDDAREAREARAVAAERERLIEQRRERAVADYVADASLRGEHLDLAALAEGRVPGRTVADVLAAASAAADADDRRTEARLHREGHGEPERLHVEFGDPVIHSARSATGLAMFNRYRRWQDRQEARRAAEAAEVAAHDWGLVDGVTRDR